MPSYILSPEALQDLNEISAFLEQKSPKAAVQFLDNVGKKCQNLAVFPNMGRRWDNLNPPLRSFPIDDYLIFYRLIEGGIEIVRLVSGYRDLETLLSKPSV